MKDMIQIGAEGVDVKKIMAEIEDRVARKKEGGVYDKYDLSRIAALELSNVKSESDFLEYSMKVIQQTWDIDIGDFPILSKGCVLGKAGVMLKKIIWKLMKFYTYRLFSQQKEFNCQVANAVVSMKNAMDKEIAEIKKCLPK